MKSGFDLDGTFGHQNYYRHRMSHAQLGRFLTRDPISYEDGVNQFAYGTQSPVTFTDPFGTRVMKPPATPRKCQEVVGLMTAYARIKQAQTYDWTLWKHYMDGTGEAMDLPIGAFDPAGENRTELALGILRQMRGKPTDFSNVGCGESKFVGSLRRSTQFKNTKTVMISTYTLTGNANFWYRRECHFGCISWCFIDYIVDFDATDTTDFNPDKPGQPPHKFGIETDIPGFEYVIHDQLILDCNIGKKFGISGHSRQIGSWLTDCDNP